MKSKYLIIILTLSAVTLPKITLAFCPVCVVAVGAGLGLARWLGVDDTITGIWIGAFLIAITGWLINWLKRKKWTFPYFGPVILVATYALTFIPLYYRDIIGHPKHTIFGIDKLIFSIMLGSIALVVSELFYKWLKKKNDNKPHFSFEKIVLPIVMLAILSVVFYFVTKTPH